MSPDITVFNGNYLEKQSTTYFVRLFFCALVAALLLCFIFLSWPQNITPASINIVKQPMAVTIHWASVPIPKSTASTSPSMNNTKKLIHQRSTKQSIPSINSKRSPALPTSTTIKKPPIKTKPLQKKSDAQQLETPEIITTTTTTTTTTTPTAPLTDTNSTQLESVASKGSRQAKSLSGRKPDYPRTAIRRQQQGRVLVKLTVDTLGKTSNIQLVSSSGYYLLDQSVLKFTKNERFNPATRNETPVISRQEFGFVFTLK